MGCGGRGIYPRLRLSANNLSRRESRKKLRALRLGSIFGRKLPGKDHNDGFAFFALANMLPLFFSGPFLPL
jgi:hypothetical protein